MQNKTKAIKMAKKKFSHLGRPGNHAQLLQILPQCTLTHDSNEWTEDWYGKKNPRISTRFSFEVKNKHIVSTSEYSGRLAEAPKGVRIASNPRRRAIEAEKRANKAFYHTFHTYDICPRTGEVTAHHENGTRFAERMFNACVRQYEKQSKNR